MNLKELLQLAEGKSPKLSVHAQLLALQPGQKAPATCVPFLKRIVKKAERLAFDSVDPSDYDSDYTKAQFEDGIMTSCTHIYVCTNGFSMEVAIDTDDIGGSYDTKNFYLDTTGKTRIKEAEAGDKADVTLEGDGETFINIEDAPAARAANEKRLADFDAAVKAAIPKDRARMSALLSGLQKELERKIPGAKGTITVNSANRNPLYVPEELCVKLPTGKLLTIGLHFRYNVVDGDPAPLAQYAVTAFKTEKPLSGPANTIYTDGKNLWIFPVISGRHSVDEMVKITMRELMQHLP